VAPDLGLPYNALEVLKSRYLLRDERGAIVETPVDLFRRVAKAVASVEDRFRSTMGRDKVEEIFFRMMAQREFLPNSPALMNAGTPLGQLSACFVLPVGDSLHEIFEALKRMAVIHQTGGGTGFSFSHLRHRGDLVTSTMRESSGPVSFMSIYDQATSVIMQGGRRRGANMGILRCDHPDIMEFTQAKTREEAFSNFNLSVAVTSEFMEAAQKGKLFDLISPRTGLKVRSVNARMIFDLIVNCAWMTGDPGLLFIDEINARHPLRLQGEIEATNPCGEVPLLPYESCNLGSINLAKMAGSDGIDYVRLQAVTALGIRFLDNVIEAGRYPMHEIREVTLANRKIGLGVMGFADMLIKLRIPYTSPQAVTTARNLMRFIHHESLKASSALAEERGVFPSYDRSIYPSQGVRMRNATVNTVAPTGTLSILAGCSSSIEPIFAVSFVRRVLSGATLFELNPLFEEEAGARGILTEELHEKIRNVKSLHDLGEIPEDLRRIFVTAFDVSPGQHLRIQAAFQEYCDNSVSKTINLPAEASVQDVRKIYLDAWKLGLKGITVYRYGTKKDQVLSLGERTRNPEGAAQGPIIAQAEYAGDCPSGICPL
jgi:ribonucleoside-diphosphate reductase alpha chain